MTRIFTFLLLACLGLSSACSTVSRLHTFPEGASVYVNGKLVGQTPAVYHDERGLPRRYRMQVVKEGYQPVDLYVDSTMSYGFTALGFITYGFALLWAWRLSDDYTFHLKPQAVTVPTEPAPGSPSPSTTEPTPEPTPVP